MISPRMAKVNARVTRARAYLARLGWPSASHWSWGVRCAWRDLMLAERRQRHLRRLEGKS